MADVSTHAVGMVAPRRRGLRRVAVFVSLGLVLLAMVASLFLVRTVESQLADLGNTYEVRRQARELMLAISEAETGQRGYLLTRDPAYLEPYNTAIGNLSKTYDQLLALVEANPSQRLRLQTILPEIDAKRAEMAGTIDLMSSGEVDRALAVLRSDAGNELMQRIRTSLRSFIAEEDAKLLERNNSVRLYRQSLIAAMLAALAAAAVLAYTLIVRSQRRVDELWQEQSALRSLNEELEERVRERTSEAEEARAHAERERARVETLLQDTNHRIGNSLATVSSLLGLQLARTSSDEVRLALESAQARVQAIASGHRRLRLGADLETTNAAEFLDDVVEDLAASVPVDKQVKFEKDLAPVIIPARDATTIGIVVSELVVNALKHGFDESAGGTIWVRFARSANGIAVLTVEDDGRGIKDGAQPQAGLGALIINQLARQFGGPEPSYQSRAGGGTAIVIELPKLKVG